MEVSESAKMLPSLDPVMYDDCSEFLMQVKHFLKVIFIHLAKEIQSFEVIVMNIHSP